MIYSYRITKYYLASENGHLSSDDSDWTSFHDVGIKTSLQDYMQIENAYVEIISNLCRYLEISFLIIDQLEVYDKNEIFDYANQDKLDIHKIDHIIRMVLREKLWCKLKSKQCEFHFGYDYYMYCVSNTDLTHFIETTSTILNIQKFISPYLD
ncbi:hypothetical protein [Thorsellia anophelis]|uniref:Uncharacterized protein n=1 Tax=Thorsellia anophelis DSM 18579 TaxID=1123402 RepID=A0A1I0D1X6_9GAMM|nr:hypothetical protein [Thorsellia anophelis]SET26168.1 hypothetical protein SAMN02583745_01832 [Thorsellia anophelis DSM 18579]